MKKFIYFLFVTFLTLSCGDDIKKTDPLEGKKIELSVDKDRIEAGGKDVCTFAVKLMPDDKDITNECKFYASGDEIVSNKFSRKEEGSFNIVAKYKSIESNTVSIVVKKKGQSLSFKMSLSSNNINLNDDNAHILATVIDQDGFDLTADAIFAINGKDIKGNILKFTEVGEYVITGKVNNNGTFVPISNEEKIKVIKPASVGTFVQKMLIENMTATWCGPCIPVKAAITSFLKNNTDDRAYAIMIHTGAGSGDPYASEIEKDGVIMSNAWDIRGIPFVSINRTAFEQSRVASAYNNYLKSLPNESPLGIAIESKLSDDKKTVNVKCKLVSNRTISDGQIIIVLTEDINVGGYDTYVVRNYATGFAGDKIELSANVEKEIEKSFTFKADKWKNNCRITVFVTEGTNKVLNKFVNVQRVTLGESVDYSRK